MLRVDAKHGVHVAFGRRGLKAKLGQEDRENLCGEYVSSGRSHLAHKVFVVDIVDVDANRV